MTENFQHLAAGQADHGISRPFFRTLGSRFKQIAVTTARYLDIAGERGVEVSQYLTSDGNMIETLSGKFGKIIQCHDFSPE